MAMKRQSNVTSQQVTTDPFTYAKGGAGQKTGNPMVLGNKKP